MTPLFVGSNPTTPCFKEEWDVKIIPPFAGAIIRFVVRHKNKIVSVYFDGYSNLGFVYDEQGQPIPYWEAYPINSDIMRYELGEENTMLKDIEDELNSGDRSTV